MPTTAFGAGSLILSNGASWNTDCGAVSMYGLIYDVLRAEDYLATNGFGRINIYYAYASAKGSPNRCVPTNKDTPPMLPGDPRWNDGCDFSVAGAAPVTLVTNASASNPLLDTTAATIKTTSKSGVYPGYTNQTIDSSVSQVNFLGGPFVIQSGTEATLFAELLDGTITAQDSFGNNIDFSPFRNARSCGGLGSSNYVNIYRAQFPFSAETNVAFNARPPRLALLDTDSRVTGGVSGGILPAYLTNAGLNFPGAQGCPPGGTNARNRGTCPNGGTPGQIFDIFDFRDLVNNLETLNDSKGVPLYAAVWAPHWDSTAGRTSGANSSEKSAIGNLSSFLDNANGFSAECASIQSVEGVTGNAENVSTQFLTCIDNGMGGCASSTTFYGLNKDSGSNPTGTQPNCTDPNRSNGNQCVFYSYPGDPFIQIGDNQWQGLGGSVQSFQPNTGANSRYRPSVRPLVSGVASLNTAKTGSPSLARAMIIDEFAAYGYKNDDPTKGQIHYMGGHNLSNTVVGNIFILETLLQLGTTATSIEPTITEVSRASPVIAQIEGNPALVQGTFENAQPVPVAKTITLDIDAANFTFPAQKGHMYAVATSNITTSPTKFKDTGELFDVATQLPPATYAGCGSYFTSGCRTVFTNTATGAFPAGGGGKLAAPAYTFIQSSSRGALTAAVSATVGTNVPTISAATVDVILSHIVAGAHAGLGFAPQLGGVDRSTAAVVGTSSVATAITGVSGGNRPTMIYFGATDGMLHAACAEVKGPCDVEGRELWAFMPRTQLPFVRLNQTRLDGTPRVVDMFGDFYGTGTKTFKTILFITTTSAATTATGLGLGIAGQTPAVYAMDITDPTSPRLLWEYTIPTPATPRAFELGSSLLVTAGQAISTAGVPRQLVFVESNNGGSAGASAGVVVVALDAETGKEFNTLNGGWATNPFGYTYPAPPRGSPLLAIPTTAIPGGAVGVDKKLLGNIDSVVFGDIYGDLWELDPATGVAKPTAATALFSYSTNFHPIGAPPAIYSNGTRQFAIFATGGYTDYSVNPAWNGATQFLTSVQLDSTVGSLNEGSVTTSNGFPNVPINVSLAAGEKGFSQVTVVGNQIFVSTDSTDVNASAYGTTGTATGTAEAYTLAANNTNLAAVTPTFVITTDNGASSIANDGTNLYSSSGDANQQLATGATSTTGPKVEMTLGIKVARNLWLRTE